MSTRSAIGYRNAAGEVRGIYCHWDGYVENNGKILLESYTDAAKIAAMVELGDLSSLGAAIGNQVAFDSPMDVREGQCVAYGRDRGETDVAAQTFDNIDEFVTHFADGVDYMYVWNGNEWIVTNGNLIFDRVEDLLAAQAAA
jgi:hypothetical protein|tara:strand:- start:87 stop:512 length:426 start_codon:yes stop_codon:yes gene_type:complete